MPCAPVSSTQRALESGAASALSVALIASRMGWSSALRLAGFEIVRRTTPSAGSSMSSLPSASSRDIALDDIARKASRVSARAVARLAVVPRRIRGCPRADRSIHCHSRADGSVGVRAPINPLAFARGWIRRLRAPMDPRLFEHEQRVALVDRLALLAKDL